MIGMVLVTHGKLAAEFLAALEHVVGKQQKVATVCIGAEDDMEQRRKEILERVKEVESGDGVVLLTDMFGGTPSNLAISVLDRANVEVIAGINLPMLIKLAGMREGHTLQAAVTAAGRLIEPRTEASLISIGRLTPAITSTLPPRMTEMARLEGVPPNISVRMMTPLPSSAFSTASRMS